MPPSDFELPHTMSLVDPGERSLAEVYRLVLNATRRSPRGGCDVIPVVEMLDDTLE